MRFTLSKSAIRHVYRYLSSSSSSSTDSTSAQLVRMDRAGPGIHVLMMQNERQANCLSLPMLRELRACLKQLGRDKDARAIIIRGTDRFFSAGHDLNELIGEKGDHSPADVLAACSEFMQELDKLPIPTIAAVMGPAHAAGCQLVCTCDLAVAGQSATFAVPGVKIGLFCSTPGVALTRSIGIRAAKELLLTGRPISATRSYELGLVHRVVPDDQVHQAAVDLASQITQHSGPIVRMGKRALQTQAAMDDLSDAYDLTTQVMLENLQLKDTQLGIHAFLNKQPMPTWSHEKDD